MTDFEDAEARRRGYWLRRARLTADVTLSDAAVTAGLKAKSGSTVSLWEQGKRPIRVLQLNRLARRYGVPVTWFTDPPLTDDERIAQAIADAAALEREDSGAAGGSRPPSGDGRAARPRKLSA